MVGRVRFIVETAVYTAITFLATVLLVVETPATGGYFNLGEAAIYSIAFLTSPLVAGVAGGLGPAIADVVLGFGYYAPGTFAIKFAEGYLVSTLARRAGRGLRAAAAALAVVAAMALALVVAVAAPTGEAGVQVYWTPTRLFGVEVPVPTVSVTLPSWVWYLLAALILVVALAGVVERRGLLLPITAGGMVMVTGYFLYEFLYVNPIVLGRDPWGAVFEVPVNIGQVVAGALLSYPVVRFVARALPGETASEST